MKYNNLYDKKRGRESEFTGDLELKDRSFSVLIDNLFIHSSDEYGFPFKPGLCGEYV